MGEEQESVAVSFGARNDAWHDAGDASEGGRRDTKLESSNTTAIINALKKNVTSGKESNVADTLKGVLSSNKENLKVAMRAKKDMIALIDTIEKMKTATVTPTNNATGIASVTSVVGAGLNVTSKNVTLTVQPSTTQDLQLDEELKKNVKGAVEISLMDGDAKKTGALDIPVSVTITVPTGISGNGLVILHMKSDGKVEEHLYPINNGDGTVTFTVTHFSTFVFVGGEQSNGGSGSDNKDDEKRYGDEAAAQIASAAKGATVKTKDLTALPNSVMKMLLKRNDVTLVMEYTYNGRAYTVTIPAGAAIDNDIPWYGPLYLAGYYGNGANTVAAPAAGAPVSESSYVVKRGDTMSRIAKANGMTLAQLIQKNPQIKNVRYIKVGQKINL